MTSRELFEKNIKYSLEAGDLTKLDDWSAYRALLQCLTQGVKCVDFLIMGPDRFLHLVEVKDYRFPGTPKKRESELAEDVSGKFVGALSLLALARLYAGDAEERRLAERAGAAQEIHLVLHCEVPDDDATWLEWRGHVQQKLRQRFRPLLETVSPIFTVRVVHHGTAGLTWSTSDGTSTTT